MTSLLIIATDPVLARSSTTRTVWSRNGVGETVDREVHVPEVAAADAELAAEVVARRHARQDLDGAKRVVREDAAQVLQFGAAQGLLHGGSRLGGAKRRPPSP